MQAYKIYGLLNKTCFGNSLPANATIQFEEPVATGSKYGTLHRVSLHTPVLSDHGVDVSNFRKPLVIRVFRPCTCTVVMVAQTVLATKPSAVTLQRGTVCVFCVISNDF